MLPEYFSFQLPTKVVYGSSILDNIAEEVSFFGKQKALLVTDRVLLDAGPVELLTKGFSGTDIEITDVFSDVPPNSTIACVTACAEKIKEKNCSLVIAAGGGSVIDTAKVANLLAVKGRALQDHMGAWLLHRNEKLLPFVVVPTTAGTGSEVTRVAVILDEINQVKLPFSEEQFLPQLAILDPRMTATMPGRLTAATGMDALTHAIEAYVDKEWSPASDAFALHAIQLITRNILLACARPENLAARGAMLTGSFLAGVAFTHSMVGMAHGIAHALGGVYHIPHGLANALVLPEVMAHNLPARISRYADIAGAMGIFLPNLAEKGRKMASGPGFFSKGTETGGWFQETARKTKGLTLNALNRLRVVDEWGRKQAACQAVDKVRLINRQLAYLTGMPLNLKEAGITDGLARLGEVADKAMEDGAMLYNPVEPDRESVIRIVTKVHDQKITPIPVADSELTAAASQAVGGGEKEIFESTEKLYDVLMGFFEKLNNHPEIGPALIKTNLLIQFHYTHPEGVITVDATGPELALTAGDTDKKPEVTMKMKADFAHKFWHGKANLVTALTRRQVVAKGNVPKTLKLLPILKPAYALYPEYLKEKNLAHLILA